MELEIFQVDAFANATFEGNPAAICILDEWLPDIVMQAIAMEMNLSETCFVVRKEDNFRIRWFTPTIEVKLCGHATLAAAHVLYKHMDMPKQPIRFHSLSGILVAHITPEGLISLDFPSNPPKPTTLTHEIISALGGAPVEVLEDDDLVVVYSDATEIEILTPNFSAIKALPYRGVVATAPGNGYKYDFVCRFFAPGAGIDEDPVTGSAFTELAPYYADKLGKQDFFAKQISKRGGEVHVTLDGHRTHLAGSAITVMQSRLFLNY